MRARRSGRGRSAPCCLAWVVFDGVAAAAAAVAVAGFQAVAAATSLQRSFQVESIGPQSATVMSTDRRTFARSEKTLLSTWQAPEQATEGDEVKVDAKLI
jgi:hypothetical protein